MSLSIFLAKVEQDPRLAQKLGLINDEESFVELGKAVNIELVREDFLRLQQAQQKILAEVDELGDDELESAVGGVTPTTVAIAGYGALGYLGGYLAEKGLDYIWDNYIA